MSWDIIAQDLPQSATSVEEIPDCFQLQPIGNRSQLIAQIRYVVPQADFTDPSWDIIEGDDSSIEVSTGDAEVCESIAFHVRGGDGAIGAVAAILDELKFRAIDCQSSEFFQQVGKRLRVSMLGGATAIASSTGIAPNNRFNRSRGPRGF
jgi:hypothetical protein